MAQSSFDMQSLAQELDIIDKNMANDVEMEAEKEVKEEVAQINHHHSIKPDFQTPQKKKLHSSLSFSSSRYSPYSAVKALARRKIYQTGTNTKQEPMDMDDEPKFSAGNETGVEEAMEMDNYVIAPLVDVKGVAQNTPMVETIYYDDATTTQNIVTIQSPQESRATTPIKTPESLKTSAIDKLDSSIGDDVCLGGELSDESDEEPYSDFYDSDGAWVKGTKQDDY